MCWWKRIPDLLPLNPATVFHLALIGVALSGALAVQFGWRWRTVLLFVAVALPVGFLWSEAPTGQYAGLAYVIVLGASALALVLGVALGCVLRFAASGVLVSIVAIFFVAASATGFELYRQYVPNACLESSLQVRIAGKILRIPSELRPRLENGDDIGHWGRMDRKLDSARFCRMSENGTHAIDMDTVWLTPASNHSAMSSACSANERPNWCDSYSPEPYRYIGKIFFAPEADPGFPLPYWKEGGSLKKNRQGDLNLGSVCLLPDAGTRTTCWIWQPFGDGSRLTVSTNNLDPAFDEMPIVVAREMLRQAREVTLSIFD